MSDLESIYDYLGGGWISLVLVALLAVVIGYLKYAEKKAKRERAQKQTDKNRAKDQAELSERNQSAQEDWDEGMTEIDRIREEAKKND